MCTWGFGMTKWWPTPSEQSLRTRHRAERFTHLALLKIHGYLLRYILLPSLTEKTETHKGELTCPRLHSQEGFDPGLPIRTKEEKSQ